MKYILKENTSSLETWYHGTYNKDDFEYDVNKALFVTREKEIAKHYSGDGHGFFDSGNTNGVIFEVKILKSYSMFKLTAEEYFSYGIDLPIDEWQDLWIKWINTMELDEDPFDEDFEDINKELVDKARQRNKDVLFIEGDMDATPMRDLDEDQMAIINHEIIKSIEEIK